MAQTETETKKPDLPAGRALDALVAERVMGCTPEAHHMEKYSPTCGCKHRIHRNTREDLGDLLADYSTDIGAAWEVGEKLGHKTFSLTGPEDKEPVTWCAEFGSFQDAVFQAEDAEADTAPHAICLAALKAVDGA